MDEKQIESYALLKIMTSIIIIILVIVAFLYYTRHDGPAELTNERWGKIIETGQPVVILVYSENCRICYLYEPTFKAIAKEMRHVATFYKLDYNGRAHDVAIFLKVDAVPATIIYRNGIIKKLVGNQLKQKVKRAIKENIAP